MPDEQIREALAAHWQASASGDIDKEHNIYLDGAICDYPQSGERILGRRNLQPLREHHPGKPSGFEVKRISGAGDLWVTEYTITYEGRSFYTVSIMQFRAGKVEHGTQFATPRRVAKLDRLADGAFCSTFDDGRRVRSRAVVVATGVQYRRLPVDGLARFEGTGVYYAATENEARYCKGAQTIVIGGGNSAGQAAMFLSRAATHVRLVVRGQSLAASMSDHLSSRLLANRQLRSNTARKSWDFTAPEGLRRRRCVAWPAARSACFRHAQSSS
jgi:hypothetical protein